MQRHCCAGPWGVRAVLCSEGGSVSRPCANVSGHSVVGLQVLEREERSLGSLLEDFCGMRKQKQHQRADWRQR